MADYARFVQLAQRLLSANGRLVSLQRLSTVANNPAKPWAGQGTPVVDELVDAVPAVFLPAQGGGLGTEMIAPELLKRAEKIALVPPGYADCTRFHTVLDGVQRWSISHVGVLAPGDTVCLYQLVLTR